MKRMLALLCAAVYSIFAGVGFVSPKADDFYFDPVTGEGAYFQVDVAATGENYRSLYSQVYGVSGSRADVCDTTRRQDSREVWTPIKDAYPSYTSGWNSSLYEPVEEGTSASQIQNGISYTIQEDGVNICAPAAGTINTSHYYCDYGSRMEYLMSFSDGSTYTMTITGAKCWYCCANKAEPADGRYTATTSTSLKGNTMRAGDVLCIGKSGAVITIINSAG